MANLNEKQTRPGGNDLFYRSGRAFAVPVLTKDVVSEWNDGIPSPSHCQTAVMRHYRFQSRSALSVDLFWLDAFLRF